MALIENKKARFNYEILETYRAGLELFGHEVKSLRNKKASLEGAYVKIRGREAYLVGATIEPYQALNTPESYDPIRPRRLLLKKKEILDLLNYDNKKGLTMVPISVYNIGRNLKLEFGVARGKKKFDKRESIKKKDTDRDILREAKFKLR